MGVLDSSTANYVINAKGKAVSPGFINMIGWGVTSLVKDGRGLSDISQGITLEGIWRRQFHGAFKSFHASRFSKILGWH